jgi:hypothetical protein
LSEGREESTVARPTQFALYPAYPNPFNPTTTIKYDLPVDAHTHLKVYDLLGREVASLVDGDMEAGNHHVQFDARSMASGIYFYRIEAENFTSVRKIVVMR